MMGTKDQDELSRALSLSPEIMLGLLDNRYEGITIIDKKGLIIYISQSTERYFGLKRGEGIDKHVNEVFPGSELHRVAITGKAEIGIRVKVRGQEKIVSRIPISHNKKIIGAVSKVMFRDVGSLRLASQGSPNPVELPSYSCSHPQEMETACYVIENFIGASPQAIAVKEFVHMAYKSSSNVLITSESGCGKEVVAQSIHNLSARSSNRFVTINCSAIPRDLFESELFGYAPGAFTGATKKGKDGMFRLAHNGTMFLDEITELPLEMQPKLLRVLQEKSFYPVGGKEKVEANFRLICATNRDMEKMVDDGKFRQDLFFRLNVLYLRIPPLRERVEDIPDISYYLLSRLKNEMETAVDKISPDVLNIFSRYFWKGNVRELANILERALNVADGDTIEVEHLPKTLVAASEERQYGTAGTTKLKTQKVRTEKFCILDALEQTRGNRTAAAKLLGIHRTHLYKKMKMYGLS